MTSEEKLLKLIRKQDQSSKKESFRKKESSGKKIDFLKVVNGALIIAVLVIGAFLVYEFVLTEDTGSPLLNRSINEVPRPVNDAPLNVEPVSLQPFGYYQASYEERDLFEYPWNNQEVKQPTAEVVSVPPLAGRLVIVGLLLDENSKAIIEDTQVKQTFFLSVGEEIAGAVVQEITEEKVILKYNNQLIELTR